MKLAQKMSRAAGMYRQMAAMHYDGGEMAATKE
jgi:hypothetical protein